MVDPVNAVLQRATAKNPSQRYADVLAFAAAFRDAAQLSSTSSSKSVEEMLTLREHEILQLMVDGKSNKEIAQTLFLLV